MKSSSCPYLGLKDDPETHLAFPSTRNHCLRARPVGVVRLDHQSAYCLNPNYTNCPVLTNDQALSLFPELRAFRLIQNKKRVGIGILAVMFATILLVGWWQRGLLAHSASPSYETPSFETSEPGLFSPSTLPISIKEEMPTDSIIMDIPPVPTTTSTETPLPPTLPPTVTDTPFPSRTAENINTPTPDIPPENCTTPAGWVIYIVQPKDSLFHIGLDYGVTVAELQAANCMGSSVTIYAGHKLYVPNNPTRTSQATSTFTPVQATPIDTPMDTNTPVPSDTPLPTDTPLPPKDTPVPTDTPIPYPAPGIIVH